MPMFDLGGVNGRLEGTIFHGRLHHFTTIDSTNTRALSDALAGAEAGQVYLADEQTAGRGRGGHTWHSEPDRGLYLTVLLRPRLRAEQSLQLSLAAGLAACAAIETVTGFRIDLRWPNDLVAPVENAASRKLGGVLTEAASAPDGMLRHAAVGIGINLNQVDFPPELQATATSLRLAAGMRVEREALASALLRRLDAELHMLEDGEAGDVFARFAAVSSWVYGKEVTVEEGEGYTGVTDGLTGAGLLRVRQANGSIREVRHGGVRERLAAAQERKA